MKKILTILNNKIVAVRYDSRDLIRDGEVEDDGTYGDFKDILIDGVWEIDLKEIAEQEKQQEIAELNAWLDLRRNIEHPDKAVKQARLIELIG